MLVIIIPETGKKSCLFPVNPWQKIKNPGLDNRGSWQL
ncbi:hypothetical protein KKC1_22950 [Calderihabitans maritimus]|uniref:Uncharacterized protein n=1 Tax=Calderihabitans maritimus TaxID=1246530 RepID=A0A1Z5HUF6_9FIRM|nr:hypothetical protein KKC1_22950 [Calderihabitans maritimus]